MRWVLAITLVACSGDGGDDGSDPTTGSYPLDSSSDGIAAFLAAGAYQDAPWISETSGPRDRSSDVSPHGQVRVWANDVLVASQDAGNGELGGAAHESGSMAVKEMFDAAGTLWATAAMLKLEGAASEWAYYCEGPADVCGVTGTTPVWGIGLDTECGFCHGGLVFNTF